MQITCYRNAELTREDRTLPAATYNIAHALLARSHTGAVFVPIRSMQFLAVLDAEEFIFLDGVRKCWVDIAWQHFHPQIRNSLEEPVPYQAIYYQPNSTQVMKQLQLEFARALHQLGAKERYESSAQVIKFPAAMTR